jgi:hypothetical protein
LRLKSMKYSRCVGMRANEGSMLLKGIVASIERSLKVWRVMADVVFVDSKWMDLSPRV